MSAFPWTEHTATSVLTPGKHLHATLCQCKCLRACLYKVHVSQGRYVAGSEVRLFPPPPHTFFFAFDLNLRALPSRAGSLRPPFVFKRSCVLVFFLQASPLSVSGEHELWPVTMEGRRAKVSVLVPQQSSNGSDAYWMRDSRSGITQKSDDLLLYVTDPIRGSNRLLS